MMLDHSAGVPALARAGEGQRTLRMGLHDRAPGRRGAVLAARHAQRLSRLHLRLDGGRDGAARRRRVARHVLPERGGQAAWPRFLDRPARGDRTAGRADHALCLQGGRGQDAVHARSRPTGVGRRPVLLQCRRLADRRRQRRAGHAAEIGAANGVTNARGLAGMYAPLANGGGKLVDAQDARPDGRGLDGHARRRHLAHPHALRAGLHEVDGQPQAQPGRQAVRRGCRQRDPGFAPPSAMSARAARWASPIPRPDCRSATP